MTDDHIDNLDLTPTPNVDAIGQPTEADRAASKDAEKTGPTVTPEDEELAAKLGDFA